MYRTRSLLLRATGVALVALTVSWAGGLGADEPAKTGGDEGTIPRFPGGEVERVTVDVVVLDHDGHPVTGLKKDDFQVEDEGHQRVLDSFELVDRRVGRAVEPEEPPHVATNMVDQDKEDRRRTFVIIFDDLHLESSFAPGAKEAVAAFLDKGTVPGDRVTLMNTSGSTRWTTTMPGGREDLMAILKRLEGHLVRETPSERITDYEALQIFQYHDARLARSVQERLEQYGTKPKGEMSPWQAENMMDFYMRGYVDPYISMRARRTYQKVRTRMGASLSIMERAMRALSEGRDRKSLILMSQGFVDDPSQPGMKRLVQLARRVNASIYFVDVSGLRLLNPMYSAEFGNQAVDAGDILGSIADVGREGAGAVALADDTGGFAIRDSNDFERGAARIGIESQCYYLLGYDPGNIPHDGRFRKLKVQVRGNYTVRARRGYYAPSDEDKPAGPQPPKDVDPVLQHALDAARPEAGIPLRMTTYVTDKGVLMVGEADISNLQYEKEDGARVGTLDTLAVVAHRDDDAIQREDQSVTLRLQPRKHTGPLWYSFVREFDVPPGLHQARLVVRDPGTGRVGSVMYQFRVPAKDELHLSTPVISDTLTKSADGSASPALLARRSFAAGSLLYCRFDVYGAKLGPNGMPQVLSGYALRRSTGEAIGSAAPTMIQPTSGGALARMVQIPLRSEPPGDYELVLTVTDELSGESREQVEPFSIEARRVSSVQ
jgi:VWFA-related protein